jgi:hypothetical protein
MNEWSSTEIPDTPLKVRIYFWLMLSVFSVFYAEVISGSSVQGVLSFWGIAVLIPLYGLHVLLLGALAYRNGTPRLVTLWSAGAVLGLYEAYVTKMLWHHTWGPQQWPIAGISLFAFIQLVICWHPLMAFMAPIFTAAASTRNGAVVLPERSVKWLGDGRQTFLAAAALGAFAGLSHGMAVDRIQVFALLNGAVLVILLYIWRNITRKWDASMNELLPLGRELYILGAILAVYFLLLGYGIRRDAIPGFEGQFTIWLLYVFFLGLTIRTSRTPKPLIPSETPRLPPASFAVYVLSLAVIAMPVGIIFGHFKILMFLLLYAFYWFIGFSFLFFSIKESLKRS